MTLKPYILVYLSFQINSKSKIIQFHSWIFSFARTSNQFPRKIMFFQFPSDFFFKLLARWLEMWFFANAIPSPMSMPYISLLKPTSLTCFQGTKWIQDKRDQGQNGTRTKWIQDKMEPGQNGSRTIRNQDNKEPGQ